MQPIARLLVGFRLEGARFKACDRIGNFAASGGAKRLRLCLDHARVGEIGERGLAIGVRALCDFTLVLRVVNAVHRERKVRARARNPRARVVVLNGSQALGFGELGVRGVCVSA